ncbi:hypothetical protein BGZ63DRAFT_391064 [Mariannaea sp. PMI_226]|nr:hypothetical protein BGZ63DRAFT_391064 [Mariannaea sp. PMI_226]
MASVATSSDQAAWEAIIGFLNAAVDIHNVAHAVHAGSPKSGPISVDFDLEERVGQASLCVLALLKLFNTASSTVGNAITLRLMHSCVKIGQGIVAQVDLARPSLLDADSPQIDAEQFYALWSRADVVALNERLTELIARCQELKPSISTDRLKLPESPSGLTISNSTNDGLNTELQKKSRDHPDEGSDDHLGTNIGFERSNYDKPPLVPKLAPIGLINDFFLETLAFKSMYDREDEVTEAHTKTLEWIFDNTAVDDQLQKHFRDEFILWLKTNNLGPIYWITGKPGSGKSTLTGFLYQHSTTKKLLQQWAGDRPFLVAGFFFWTSGTRDQRSQAGLLRSLLHQLLSANPHLIPAAFPTLWNRLRQMSTKERVRLSLEWSVPDLMDAFHLLLDAALPTMNICLFIDGLDEFDGDHTSIIDFFKTLSVGHNSHALKMCLSSRPWTVFSDAFEHDVPNGRLQDLTHDDMYQYAKDELRNNHYIKKAFRKDPAFEHDFVENLVQQADGVFLWVRLAVERILHLMEKTHSNEDLNFIVSSFPRELDDFFEKLIFKDQTLAHITEAADLFRLMCAREVVADFIKDDSSNSLTAWEVAFALNSDEDNSALQAQVKQASLEEIVSRYQMTAERVQTRFVGLLNLHRRRRLGNLRVPRFVDEKHGVAEPFFVYDKVTYIHRTVRDWLMNASGAYKRLNAVSTAGFDPHLRLLRSYVLRLKHPLEEVEHHRRLDEWYPDIALAMSHARYVDTDPSQLQQPFLNEMNKTLSWYWLSKSSDPFDHWARSAFGSYEIRMKAPPIRRPFLCLATKFGLTEYVSKELEDLGQQDGLDDAVDGAPEPTPLLSYATEFLCSRNKTIFPVSDPSLVEYLIRNPSPKINLRPNDTYTDFVTHAARTPWLALLRHLRDAHRRGWIVKDDSSADGVSRWEKIVKLFIEVGGADVNAVVVADAWDPEISAVGVLRLVEDASGGLGVRDIRALMEKLQVKT